MLVEMGFWLCLVLVLYIYVRLSSGRFLLARLTGREVRKADMEPRLLS